MGTKRRSPPPKSLDTPLPRPVRASPLRGLLYLAAVGLSLFLVLRHRDSWAPYTRYLYGPGTSSLVACHADFDDGRATHANSAFCSPESDALYHVNVMLGNGG